MSQWKTDLVNQVKAWQKTSASHKEAWYRWVQEKTGESNFDPNRHDEATLMEFTTLADSGQIELQDPTGFGSSNKKKGGGFGGGFGDWGWGGGGGGGAMTDEKQELVNQVKAFQKMSDSHKEAWYKFVQDNTGGGNFDPARHDDAILIQFLTSADAGDIELQEPTGMGKSSGGGGKKGKGKGKAKGGGGGFGGGGFGGGGFGGGGCGQNQMEEMCAMMMPMMMQMMGGMKGGGKGKRSSPY